MRLVLDGTGCVLSVAGQAWDERFPSPRDEACVGRVYAEVCDAHGGGDARLLAAAIRDVTLGSSESKTFESAGSQRHAAIRVEVLKLVPAGALVQIEPVMSASPRAGERMLFDRLQVACVATDAQFRVQYVNQAAEALFGYSLEELLGKEPFGFLIAPEYADFVRELFKMLGRGEMPEGPGFGENVTKDGRRFLSEWTNTRLLAPDGSFAGLLSACVDVTERTRMMQALEHSEQRYRSLIECLPDAILVTRGAVITFVNTAAVQLFRVEATKDLVGRRVDDLLHPDFRDAVTTTRDLLEASSPRRVQLLSASGDVFAVECVAVPLADDPSAPGSLVVLRDVSVRDALERELHQKQKLEVVGQLAGGIAHDFNNVLSTILAACSLLASRQLDDPKAREELEFIREAGESAAALTRQLLTYARRQRTEASVFDLNELMSSSQVLLRRLLGEDIELAFVPGAPLMSLRTDPRQLEQVVVNLAANARAAMPKGGRFTIATRNLEVKGQHGPAQLKPGPYVELRVSDTGHGMDQQTLARIFEPFFTTKQKGAGLGLATSYAIVTQAGGHIHAESTLDSGTVFTIYLPAFAGADRTLELPDSTPLDRSTTAATILVVDDNLALRTVAARILEQSGYRVLHAGTGNEALERSQAFSESIHLLLTDVVMPGMSGPELAPKLVAQRPQMAVLYMSGYADDLVSRHGISIPPAAFIQKPFTPRVLIEYVQRALESRAAQNIESTTNLREAM